MAELYGASHLPTRSHFPGLWKDNSKKYLFFINKKLRLSSVKSFGKTRLSFAFLSSFKNVYVRHVN